MTIYYSSPVWGVKKRGQTVLGPPPVDAFWLPSFAERHARSITASGPRLESACGNFARIYMNRERSVLTPHFVSGYADNHHARSSCVIESDLFQKSTSHHLSRVAIARVIVTVRWHSN